MIYRKGQISLLLKGTVVSDELHVIQARSRHNNSCSIHVPIFYTSSFMFSITSGPMVPI